MCFSSPFYLPAPVSSCPPAAAPPGPIRWQVWPCWPVSWLRARRWWPTSSSARGATSNLWRSRATKCSKRWWRDDLVAWPNSAQVRRDTLYTVGNEQNVSCCERRISAICQQPCEQLENMSNVNKIPSELFSVNLGFSSTSLTHCFCLQLLLPCGCTCPWRPCPSWWMPIWMR